MDENGITAAGSLDLREAPDDGPTITLSAQTWQALVTELADAKERLNEAVKQSSLMKPEQAQELYRTVNEARDLIEDGTRWVDGFVAVTEDGEQVWAKSDRAAKFNIIGALSVASQSNPDTLIQVYDVMNAAMIGVDWWAGDKKLMAVTHPEAMVIFGRSLVYIATGVIAPNAILTRAEHHVYGRGASFHDPRD